MEFKPEDYPKEYLVNGIYFSSENDMSSYYLVQFQEKSENNALVKIYTTDILENYFNTDGLINGCEIWLPERAIEYVAEIDLWGKYFFPKFNNDLQMYYDDKKYYNSGCKTDSIASLFEVISYAIEYGLNKSGITPY